MRVLGIIPFRAGSKRLPSKYALQIGNKALWQIALEHAIHAGLTPLITTDVEGQEFPPNWYDKRPKDLAQDNTPIEDVITDILLRHRGYDGFVLLNPTHPLRKVEDIKLCAAALEDFPSCTGVRKDWSYTIDEGARFACLNEQTRVPRLVVTGGIYATRVPAFLEKRKLMVTGNITRGTYHIEQGPHVDINTYEDYLMAKALMADRKDPLGKVFA